MAEVMAYTLLKVVFQKLADQAVKQIVRVHGTRSELKSLEKKLFNIQALLVDAAEKEIKEVPVQKWLNDLQHLVYDIDDILDDLAINAMHPEFVKDSGAGTSKVRKLITSCYRNFSLCTRTHHMLNDINIKIQNLEKEKETLGLMVKNGRLEVNDVRSKDSNRKLETSLVDASSIVGRQGDKDALIHKLLGDEPCSKNISIVPIVGMGGVGKTTLARLLYNEKEVNDQFEFKAWVCVSDGWDSFAISNIIFQSVTGAKKEFADLNLLQVALRDKLSGKRFLLVIDDLWTENREDWETLVRPLSACAPKSKVIITTRKEQLLRELGCRQLNKLECLLNDDAVCLFSQHALGENNFDLHPTLKAHGEDIVDKCKGLPLALIALGRLLRRKEDEVEWKEMVDSEIWSFMGAGVIPALRLSYHELPAHLKQLFAYCSLFPKGYSYNPDDLVLLWMAEGFLHKSTPSKSTEERLGHEYFQELLSRSFFQHAPNDESLFVMHDLMNDLATYVAGDFFFRLEKEMGKEVGIQALEKLRHMSFVSDEYESYEKFKVFQGATSLRTFLGVFVGVKEQWQEYNLSNKISGVLLPELPLLRVLCLSGYRITEVPESIGRLKHLRYLNLSRTRITHLPESVCELYSLQTLIVFGCSSLTNLPKSFLKLKSLQHFDIRNTSLWRDIPIGISELKSLKILSEIVIGRENDISITQLKDLRNLREKICIKVLKNAIIAPEANLSQKRLTELEVDWSTYVSDDSRKETSEKEVLDSLRPHNDGLKKLGILYYCGLEFPKWVGDPLFGRLARVSIHGCKKCTSLPPLGQLPSLKELSIRGIDNLKVVGPEFLGNGISFPSLEILCFEDMPRWEVWLTNSRSGVEYSVFPCLQNLCIKGCPKFVEVSLDALPSLRDLEIRICAAVVLKSLVRLAPSVTKLKIVSISRLSNEVWGGVILHLQALEELYVEWCNEIRYLWKSEPEACKVPVNLRKLGVGYCYDLMSLGEKDREYSYWSNILISLRTLEVRGCEKLEHFRCPKNIERLGISDCKRITCVSFSPGGGQKLKSVSIIGCHKLLLKKLREGGEENSLLINSKSMPMLEDVFILMYRNVSSIIELGNFVHLTSLKLQNCQRTETSFPDLQLQRLASLTFLQITSCPSMDAPGFWPPKLRVLIIGDLKKPISEWGQQINFPASLVDLALIGTYEKEEATSSSDLSHLLPSSLTSLEIHTFKKLERVSKGLQHLTSLQHFSILGCPATKDLPEKLLPSLLSLAIAKCPSLEESCSRRGAYWPLISHIPRIVTDND